MSNAAAELLIELGRGRPVKTFGCLKKFCEPLRHRQILLLGDREHLLLLASGEVRHQFVLLFNQCRILLLGHRSDCKDDPSQTRHELAHNFLLPESASNKRDTPHANLLNHTPQCSFCARAYHSHSDRAA